MPVSKHCGEQEDDQVERLLANTEGGPRLACGFRNGKVGIWDLGEEARFYQPIDAPGTSTAAFASDDTLVLGSSDGKLSMLDLASQDNIHFRTLSDKHSGAIHSLASSPDGLRFISGSSDNSLVIWDTKEGEILHRLDDHDGAVRSVAWSANGEYIASGSDDCSIRIWTSEGKLMSTMHAHSDAVSSVAFCYNDFIVSGSRDGSIRFWDRESGNPIGEQIVRNSAVNAITFSSDRTLIAAIYDDSYICLWDIRTICGNGHLEIPVKPEA